MNSVVNILPFIAALVSFAAVVTVYINVIVGFAGFLLYILL